MVTKPICYCDLTSCGWVKELFLLLLPFLWLKNIDSFREYTADL